MPRDRENFKIKLVVVKALEALLMCGAKESSWFIFTPRSRVQSTCASGMLALVKTSLGSSGVCELPIIAALHLLCGVVNCYERVHKCKYHL